MDIEKRFLNARELAFYLGLSEDTVRKWTVKGRIPYSKFGKSLRFDLRQIESWVKNNARFFKEHNGKAKRPSS